MTARRQLSGGLAASYECCRDAAPRPRPHLLPGDAAAPGVEAAARARPLRLHPVHRRDRRPPRRCAAGRARPRRCAAGAAASWRRWTAPAVDDPVLPAVLHTIAVFDLDPADFAAFLRSMEMDLTVTEYPTLRRPAGVHGGSAAAIGTMMLPILGPDDLAAAREPARQLGSGLPAHQLHPRRRRGPRPRPDLPAAQGPRRVRGDPGRPAARRGDGADPRA